MASKTANMRNSQIYYNAQTDTHYYIWNVSELSFEYRIIKDGRLQPVNWVGSSYVSKLGKCLTEAEKKQFMSECTVKIVTDKAMLRVAAIKNALMKSPNADISAEFQNILADMDAKKCIKTIYMQLCELMPIEQNY